MTTLGGRFMKSNPRKSIIAAVALGLGLASGSASALTWFNPSTIFEDDSMEFFPFLDITGDGISDGDVNGNGILEVGDTVIAVFKQHFTTPGPGSPAGPAVPIAPDELTGVGVATLVAAIPTGIPGQFTHVFGPATLGLNAWLGLGIPSGGNGANAFGAAGGGAIVAAYLDPTPNLPLPGGFPCLSMSDCIGLASDGALWEVDGFIGDADEVFFSIGIGQLWDADESFATPSADDAGSTTIIAPEIFALSVIYNGTGQDLIPITCLGGCDPFTPGDGVIGELSVDGGMKGSGSVFGGVVINRPFLNDPDHSRAFAINDFDFEKNIQRIPEPASLALIAVGLIGMGATMRRRNSGQA